MKKKFIPLIVFVLTIAGCTKSQTVKTLPVKADGEIMGGIGCTAWLIQLDNNTIIEPANLSSFNITIKSGQRVSVSYQKNSNQLSTCENGEVVNLISIVDK